jgi:hypothetical protein
MVGEPGLGRPAVDDGADADADEQVGPDLAQDRGDLLAAHLQPVVPRQTLRRVDRLAAQLGLEHERLDPPLETQPAEDGAGDDGDEEPEADVDGGDPQPNRPNSSTIATSFTIGDAMRKLRVTPRGTPAATKPMNTGTAEHEQNGVTTPSPAAATLPTPSRRPPSRARVRSTDMKLRNTVTRKITPVSSRTILLTS